MCCTKSVSRVQFAGAGWVTPTPGRDSVLGAKFAEIGSDTGKHTSLIKSLGKKNSLQDLHKWIQRNNQWPPCSPETSGIPCKLQTMGKPEPRRLPFVSPQNLRRWRKLAYFNRQCVRSLPSGSSVRKRQTDKCQVPMACVRMCCLYTEIHSGVCDVVVRGLW